MLVIQPPSAMWSGLGDSAAHPCSQNVMMLLGSYSPKEGGTDTGHSQSCHIHTQSVLPSVCAENHRFWDKLFYKCEVFKHRVEGDST